MKFRISHHLESRGTQFTEPDEWHTPIAGMFDKAKRLAAIGRIEEALLEAASAEQKNYGNSDGAVFRVATFTSKI